MGGLNVQPTHLAVARLAPHWALRASGLRVALPSTPVGRPVIFLPPGVRDNRIAAPKAKSAFARTASGKPAVHWTVTVRSAEKLANGQLGAVKRESSEGSYVTRALERTALCVATFLCKLAVDQGINLALRDVAKLYTQEVGPGVVNWFSHLLSFDRWEFKRTQGIEYARWRVEHMCPQSEGWSYLDLPDAYGEAIMLLAERLRLGPSWPRLLHSMVVTFRLIQSHPDQWHHPPSFEPIITANLIDTRRDSWYFLSTFKRVNMETPDGRIVTVSPDERFKDVLARVQDPDLRCRLRARWQDIDRKLAKVVGYQRRRKVSDQPLERVEWLFRAHVLGQNAKKIAEGVQHQWPTVSDAIKQLRGDLRLTLESSPTRGKRRTARFYAIESRVNSAAGMRRQ